MDDLQLFSACSIEEPAIESDEMNGLPELPLQVQAASKLDGIARAKRMPQEQTSRLGRHVRDELHDGERLEIALQGPQDAVALPNGQRSLPGAARDARSDFHL